MELLFTIPHDIGYIDFKVSYDVIATGGPPEPPYDVLIKGAAFESYWADLDSIEILNVADDFDEGNLELVTTLDDVIAKYLEDSKDYVHQRCWENELTN